MASAAQPDFTVVTVLLIVSLQTVQLVLAVLNSLPSLFTLSALFYEKATATQICLVLHKAIGQCCTA